MERVLNKNKSPYNKENEFCIYRILFCFASFVYIQKDIMVEILGLKNLNLYETHILKSRIFVNSFSLSTQD